MPTEPTEPDGIVNKGQESYYDDRIVVDLHHRGLVERELDQLGVKRTDAKVSEPLGLALLYLHGIDTALRGLPAEELTRTADEAREARLDAYPPEDEIPALDLLLTHLRRTFRRRHEGWTPTIAKDRLLGIVEGSPHIGGGEGIPTTATAALPPIPGRSASTGRPPVRVGMLDTKLLRRHPDLEGRYLASAEALLDHQPGRRSTAGHATFVAGIILRQAPEADLVVDSVLSDDAANPSSWDVAQKMVGFLGQNVAVLNLSFGCVTADRRPPLVLARAVELLSSVVLVASAGNHGGFREAAPDPARPYAVQTSKTPIYPAAFDSVVAVGADTAEGTPAAFSPQLPWVDLCAPGDKITSTFLAGDVQVVRRDRDYPGGGLVEVGPPTAFAAPGYATWEGTSFAAAYVTGRIAAIVDELRINAHEAVNRLVDPDPTVAGNGLARDVRPFVFLGSDS